METLGLDPSDPVPAVIETNSKDEDDFDLGDAELPMPSPSATSAAGGDGARVVIQELQPTMKAKTMTKMVSLKTRTIEEQIVAGRSDRALARFEKQQQEWESFRHHAAEKTGRPKDELVVTRAEEYRERLEVMELLDRATPEEVKSGGFNWYHQLRGDGTRFIQVGNMFSGLYLPIKLHKENYAHEIIRKPLLNELTSTRHANEASGKKKPRTWRDDEYLMARVRKYGAKMKELAPGKLEFDELLEPEVKPLRAEASAALPEEGDAVVIDEVFRHEEVQLPGVPQPRMAEEPMAASAVAKEGPHAEVIPDKLHFQMEVKMMSTQSIRVKNSGTAVIQFEWVQNLPQHGFQESFLPDDPTQHFTCHETKGRLLPGEEVQTHFSFTSAVAGTFTSSWCLKTSPKLKEPIYELFMNGTATLGDFHWERRDALRTKLSKQQTLSLASELAEDIVESVRLQPPPLPDLSKPLEQERLFEEENTAHGLFWSPHSWSQFMAIRDRVQLMMPPSSMSAGLQSTNAAEAAIAAVVPAGARGRRPVPKARPPSAAEPLPPLESLGVPSVTRLEQQLATLPGKQPEDEKPPEKIDVIRELDRACRAARKRPFERSEVWWLAYETVMDIVSVLPGKWAASRQRAGLEPLPFVSPPDEDDAPEVIEEYERKLEERKAKLGEPEKEAEVRGIFERGFMKNKFGPAVGRFSATAKEATLAARMRNAGRLSLGDRLRPYLGRQSSETAELSGNVVFYELDFGFMPPPVATPAPPSGDGEVQEQTAPQLVFEGDTRDQIKQRLQGVTAVLESGPLALLVCAHVGTPLPDQPMSAEAEGEQTEDPFLKQVKARMESLASLEPLLEVLREVSGAAATSVEFVPHEVWLGNPEAFAIKVRNEDVENKLYLLENLAAIPEETGVRRAVHPAPEGQPEPAAATETAAAPVPDIFPLTWAEREGWAVRTLREMVPENLVQDSLTESCKALTLSTGLWARAPQRIMGPFIEAEIGAFLETLQLPYRGTAAEEAAAIAELESQAAEEGKDAAPAPVLVALGGGGFGAGSAGEEELMKKLELLIGLSRLADNEKGGVHVALGGELACCVLSGVLGIRMGRTGSVAPEGAIGAALREALLEVMRTGVTISVPVDLICEAAEGEEVEFDESTAGPVFSLAASLQAVGKRPPISLGYYKGSECFLMLDPDTGSLDLKTCRFGEEAPATAAPQPAEGTEVAEDGAEAPTEPASIPNLPDTWTVRDIGQATIECLRIRLRRSRGSLWNGSLGCCED